MKEQQHQQPGEKGKREKRREESEAGRRKIRRGVKIDLKNMLDCLKAKALPLSISTPMYIKLCL